MTLTAPPRLLLVHAHPDDETLTTGGTIARYAAHGVHVTVVTCTLGEEGEVIPEGLQGLAVDHADQLGGYRVGELRSACAALGVADHRFLGGMGRWRDSGMAGVDANKHPRALVAGDPEEQVASLEAVVREVRPQVVVTYGPDGGYGHPDHVRAHEITAEAVRRVGGVDRFFHTVASRAATNTGVGALRDVPGLPYRLPEPDELPVVDDGVITTAVDVSGHLPAKLSALRAHATQVSVWQDGSGVASYALSNGIAQPVLGHEYYVLADGDPTGVEQDLFGGLFGGREADAQGAR
ncbi:N-acetyl-1-D-myo-inositol-2-amino-2-deoxy-alpha-D-glucopyranoside deacetylase [Streptoalloteichus hindustanus]|uniref:N-acetyl-1-D-myo-inositol-2-amino-2-deoxy-alpha- D-glucopyranoside deacetylase n=1 Tax=Streptoalloteichus hindustanus TaxID=2017 RepID=UPI00093598ED|nr:N-acetyl-1-D-myo-inositol-2-amino-2-deoxy-alpha-D-glucopyranoside deacetylase [Streptoalloteichus hindustanus]